MSGSEPVRVLVSPRSMTARGLENCPELDVFRERGVKLVSGPAGVLPSESQLHELVQDVDGWLAGVERIPAEVLRAAPRLRAISRNGVGADAIDLDAARELGVEVLLARGANSRGVAELAITLTLACLRDLVHSDQALHAGRWERRLGREMPDVTMGIVGFGAVGALVGQLAAAMGSTVIAHDPIVSIDGRPGDATPVSLEELFHRSDVVTLHVPPAADGTPLVTTALLSAVTPGTILINTARSSLVDDGAVLAALEDGTLGAYAVDAFEVEPPELTELLRHPNTIMTPHLGGYTSASVQRASEHAARNLITALGV